ncbi:MAG: hypothetical protein GY828_05335, partial [Candidatus Gracilibacteria bacterium]|nr:hypothetical protein [Candidatus Gracilibacteria bacterium]
MFHKHKLFFPLLGLMSVILLGLIGSLTFATSHDTGHEHSGTGMVDTSGEYFITHMENIPNPTFGSTFTVSEACKPTHLPCAWENTSTWTHGMLPGLETAVIIDGKVQINDTTPVARHVVVHPTGELYFNANE